jgi:hypothetical protein
MAYGKSHAIAKRCKSVLLWRLLTAFYLSAVLVVALG